VVEGVEGRGVVAVTATKEDFVVEKDEFTETMSVMYGALGAETPDLSLAAACVQRLLELVGEEEEEEEDEEGEGGAVTTKLELACACQDKVTRTVLVDTSVCKCKVDTYGVATVSRINKIIGLFCKRAL